MMTVTMMILLFYSVVPGNLNKVVIVVVVVVVVVVLDDGTEGFFHQQLQKNGSMVSELPPWSAGDCNISETTEETKAKPEKHAPALVNSGKHSQTPASKDPTAETTREVEGSRDINLVYSNVEGVRDASTATTLENVQAQGDQRFLPDRDEPHFKDLDSKESGENENDLYETIFPSQPLRPAPPKPPPYSSSKKLSDTVGGSGRKMVLEKVTKDFSKLWQSTIIGFFNVLI